MQHVPVKDYRPLLLQTLNARLPGLEVLRLRLNRHLPEADAMEEHHHGFSQTLCYLSGQGLLNVEGKPERIYPGTLAFIPAGIRHGFQETGGRRPLALAMDFQWKGSPTAFRAAVLNESEAARVRHLLSGISRTKDPSASNSRLLAASAALGILDIQLRALGLLPGRHPSVPPFVRKFQNLAADPANEELGVWELAAKAGYQPDYLNRKFKESTGLTLRQYRDSLRLERAKKLLGRGLAVGDAAFQSGFDDANYFTRWFRRQTGVTPGRFRGSR